MTCKILMVEMVSCLSCFGQMWHANALMGGRVISAYDFLSTCPIQTITTDLSTTPSTNTVTLAGARNALRVWTGDQDHALPWFELYTTTNGVAGPTVRLYYGQGRILSLPTNVVIAFGTTNGRAVKVSQMTIPATLPAPTGQTNTITVAKAGPPIWTPSAAQIVLPTGNRAFAVTATNDFPLFVSEFDGATWTPARWYRLEASNAVTIQATYPQVALGNYDGWGLTVVTPAGSTVNSTGATMHLTFPSVTGTSRSCATVADVMTAISNSVSGDEIVLQDGVYGLTTNIVISCFTANTAAGRIGMEGIILRSASGNRDAVIITGSDTNTGGWSLSCGDTNHPVWIKDVCFGMSNGFRQFNCSAGAFNFENVRWTGKASNALDLLLLSSSATVGFHSTLMWCSADNSAQDGYDGSGASQHTNDSIIRLIGCTGNSTGPSTSDQVVTTHTGMRLEIWGGNFSNATANVFAPDSAQSPLRVYFSNISSNGGSASSGGFANILPFGVNHIGAAQQGGMVSWALFNEMRQDPRNAPDCWHNVLRGAASVGPFYDNPPVGGVQLVGNILTSHSEAVRIGYDAGSSTNMIFVLGNTLASNTTALNLRSTVPAWVSLTNNACRINGNSIVLVGVQTNAYGANFNVFDATVSTLFNQTNSNTLNADAALDVRFFPTAAGNCDGTGFAAFPWVGDSDPWGYVWVYKQGVWPRGARSIPAIVSGAFIYPDVW